MASSGLPERVRPPDTTQLLEAPSPISPSTPGMVAARKAVIYLAGDKDAASKAERVVGGFADTCLYFGPFGAASRVKLVNNLLVAINIAAIASAQLQSFPLNLIALAILFRTKFISSRTHPPYQPTR